MRANMSLQQTRTFVAALCPFYDVATFLTPDFQVLKPVHVEELWSAPSSQPTIHKATTYRGRTLFSVHMERCVWSTY